MTSSPATPEVQIWHIDRFVFYIRNPRKNDAVVDRMMASLREFGFKIPVLARSDGTVVDGHLGSRPRASWDRGRAATSPAYPVILLRRVDRRPSQGVPADGESIGDLGRLGRRTPLA